MPALKELGKTQISKELTMHTDSMDSGTALSGIRPGSDRARKVTMRISLSLPLVAVMALTTPVWADEPPPGERPALGDRITQEMVNSQFSHKRTRQEGHRIFSTPFNKHDGLGDGPMNPSDTVSPGGRPTLHDNGTFLRMNGLDSQTCLECHGILSNAVIPATFAVGGVGGAAANALPGVIAPDIDDSENNGFADSQGRLINPPFSYGSGGVELLGKEMTADLQALKDNAEANPGTVIDLVTKGVNFGSIVFVSGTLDTSNVDGVDDDLVVRPFGRKGCCATVREFDTGAMQFHHGIQPVEVVGEGVDADGDGVANELLVGELSALHIFQVSLARPGVRGRNKQTEHGRRLFSTMGCASCHIPSLQTERKVLNVSFPEVPTDPSANAYFTIDLSKRPPLFRKAGSGVEVNLFADLKRHDMGPGLAESTGDPLDAFFTTARLWGVADTAPYLHDGRALTLTEAILLHGGEAGVARGNFEALLGHEREAVLAFLRSLRTPLHPSQDLK